MSTASDRYRKRAGVYTARVLHEGGLKRKGIEGWGLSDDLVGEKACVALSISSDRSFRH